MNRLVPENTELKWFYGIMFCFIATGLFLLVKEAYWIALLPLVALVVYLSIFSLDTILLIIAFFTPIAIVVNDKASGPALSIPGEPLMFGILLIFIFKFFFEGGFDRKISYHPVTLAIGFHLAWMFITSLTSTLPLVSLKHFVSQLWFIVPFYFLGTQLFRKLKNIKRFIWLYAGTLLIVVCYTIFRHAENNWTQKAAHWVMYPFYNDHTAYAAVLALFIPPMIAFSRDRYTSIRERYMAIFMACILVTAIILSYTRAAWLSLIVSFLVYLVYFFKIKFYNVLIILVTLVTAFLLFRTDIFIKLENNRQDSATDFNKHVRSISNISTDASNLERINRWNSALRMWEQKPFWGWGPGTYQFNYASFQKSNEMTIISTNAGNMGNAHSEYIGPLSEEGIFGMLAVVLIVITLIYRSTILYSTCRDPKIRMLTMGILMGLMTYFVHGTLNNFLDTDKLSVPFWAFIAMLVSLDVYHNENPKTKADSLSSKS